MLKTCLFGIKVKWSWSSPDNLTSLDVSSSCSHMFCSTTPGPAETLKQCWVDSFWILLTDQWKSDPGSAAVSSSRFQSAEVKQLCGFMTWCLWFSVKDVNHCDSAESLPTWRTDRCYVRLSSLPFPSLNADFVSHETCYEPEIYKLK